MELSPKQQTTELIRKSNRILITSSNNPTGDVIGSVLALGLALQKMGKEVLMVIKGPKKETFKFLPFFDEIKDSLGSSDELVVSLKTTKIQVEKLSYNRGEEKLDIIITPKEGSFNLEDVEIKKGEQKSDLIIILDTCDVEHIDPIYDEATELFFETPIINIDHKPSNEYFGTINLIDLTATSTAEILVSLIESLNPELLDPDIATCLLCGIISETTSFRTPNTTPKSLTVAAQLLALGGRQQEIIQHLFKTKPLRVLKLLGKIFSKARVNPEAHLVWSNITKKDLSDSGANCSDLNQVADEFSQTTSNSEIILLLAENENKVTGKLRCRKEYDLLPIAKIVEGWEEDGGITFEVKESSLAQAEKDITDKIVNFKLKGEENQSQNKSEYFKTEKEKKSEDSFKDDKIQPSKIEKKEKERLEEEDEIIPSSKSEIMGGDLETDVSVWRADDNS